MKSKILKTFGEKKRAKAVTTNLQKHGLPAVFVLLFAVMGTIALLRSRAATGNDLVVTAVTLQPTAPAAGQAVTFSATVKNQGSTPVPAGTVVGVAFSVDGQKVSWNESNTNGLAAGASVTLTANAGTPGATWAASNGPHLVTAVADDTNAIPDESDESNNSRIQNFTVGNTGNMYVSPASSSVLINSNVTVSVRLNPSTTVDGVEATLTYDQTRLQFVSIDPNGSAFDIELGPQTGGNGTVTLSRGNLNGGVSADGLVARVTFKALAGTGSTTLQLGGNVTKGGSYTNPTRANGTVTFTTPDATPPAVNVTSPANAATVGGTVTVNASATDNVGVTRTELFVDGQLRTSDTSSPYSFTLDTTTLANGTHTIQVRGYDAAGNVGSSSNVSLTVTNRAEDINQDGSVNLLDFSLLASKYGQTGANLGRADINGDGRVNLLDFSLLAAQYGK